MRDAQIYFNVFSRIFLLIENCLQLLVAEWIGDNFKG